MSEPKPMASLSSSLLARKGDARPAMRRAYTPGAPSPLLPLSVQEDLGWNDMGEYDEDPVVEIAPAAPPATPVVRQQREMLVQSITQSQAEAKAKPRAVPRDGNVAQTRKAKAAFTLRLDPERHLHLRLACAVNNRSAQQIVTQALDAFLGGQPEIAALANKVPGNGGGNA